MTTATSISFEDTIPSGFSAPNTTSQPVTALRPAQAPAVAPMPASLWRHTLQEHSADRRYRIVSRSMFAVIAALGASSVAYAAWQTCALMAGNHLQNAITTLMR